jgi:hypothetical protein
MCDYSLHNVASRPACVGDQLITTAFYNTNTRGLAAIDARQVAVCLRPGTELCFETRPPEPFSWWRFCFDLVGLGAVIDPAGHRAQSGERAIFRQIDMDRIAHHDAVEFADGRVVLVSKLRSGQRVAVLQLPVEDFVPGEPVEVEVGRSIEFDMMTS